MRRRRRRRWAERGASESLSSASSSAERLLAVLKGDEEREELWNLDLRISRPDAPDGGGGRLGSSPRRLQNARSMLPRHC